MSLNNSNAISPETRSYSIFSRTEKWIIVSLAALAGLFSPLTSSIYFPAIPTIAMAFNKSIELINLTVTMYMVLQGAAPMLWGTLSDRLGRRPIFVACLTVLSLSCIGLALVPTSAYWLLMLLRCMQATGSASTIALGSGVIGDISTREERGGYYGLFIMGPMVIGPAIAPVIGGVLADHLGWRSIFWFLCIASSICLVTMILFLPETLRALVGNGSITPGPIYRPLIPVIGRKYHTEGGLQEQVKVPRNPFLLFVYFDILLLLGVNAITNAVLYGVLATLSTLFIRTYPFLSETTVGLCFLSIGGGMIVGSIVTGKMLDWEYQRFKRRVGHSEQITDSRHSTSLGAATREESFPIEQARLRLLPYLILMGVGIWGGYGWCLENQVNIAGPLILQFAVGYLSIAVLNSTSTLMIDLVPKQGSSVTACNNLVRCTFGAVLVSVIDLIINAIGTGWTYIIHAGLFLLALPMVYLTIRLGPLSRAKRFRQACP
ncbi:hypothetical protein AMATHDRAFT_134375 [Amanita thiersii Skay4041]|uniref:Major facilitator superfamily (MFS) profile domain-containing protein n=1 Tax=Amanita thiersii Skay4041 TaxID=703135 RepID=A0A2A9P1V3_9AGAR|nr:hypothetical protein AMATHDRAFT_134375 [Amanita thiersii Skay4041]